MAVIERERAPARPERAVFVASDGRRARRLRRAGFAAAFVACLWVVGLGVGMLGFGGLPGVSVVKEQIDQIAGGSGAPASKRANQVSRSPQRPSATRRVVDRSSSRPVRQPTRARTRPVASRSATRPVARAPAPAPAAQTPVNPATRTRGWARTGATAPRGQIRKTVTPPPPGERGQRRGQDPTAPPPVPPGQEKKAETPPPPPPPLKKA
jgi:hypothetical protein